TSITLCTGPGTAIELGSSHAHERPHDEQPMLYQRPPISTGSQRALLGFANVSLGAITSRQGRTVTGQGPKTPPVHASRRSTAIPSAFSRTSADTSVRNSVSFDPSQRS